MDEVFKDKHGNVVILQPPNWQFSLAVIFWILNKLLFDSFLYWPTKFAFWGLLGYWAYLEITAGVNLFRRILGVIVMILTLKSFLGIF